MPARKRKRVAVVSRRAAVRELAEPEVHGHFFRDWLSFGPSKESYSDQFAERIDWVRQVFTDLALPEDLEWLKATYGGIRAISDSSEIVLVTFLEDANDYLLLWMICSFAPKATIWHVSESSLPFKQLLLCLKDSVQPLTTLEVKAAGEAWCAFAAGDILRLTHLACRPIGYESVIHAIARLLPRQEPTRVAPSLVDRTILSSLSAGEFVYVGLLRGSAYRETGFHGPTFVEWRVIQLSRWSPALVEVTRNSRRHMYVRRTKAGSDAISASGISACNVFPSCAIGGVVAYSAQCKWLVSDESPLRIVLRNSSL